MAQWANMHTMVAKKDAVCGVAFFHNFESLPRPGFCSLTYPGQKIREHSMSLSFGLFVCHSWENTVNSLVISY